MVVGLLLGSVASWRGNALRVFIRTMGLPLALVLLYYVVPAQWKRSESSFGLFGSYLVLVSTALVGDYLIGLALKRNDVAGYREDAVGH